MTAFQDHRLVAGGLMQRDEAARLLRLARSRDERVRAEALDWLFAACPQRRHVRRLKVETLLDGGDWESARAIVARGLLDDPHDPSLLLLNARCLLAEGRARDADRTIRGALDRRPNHRKTLITAARIASALGDAPRAVSLLRRATSDGRDTESVRAALVQALLDADAVGEAARTLQTLQDPAPVLAARVLRAQGRLLEAVDVLDEGWRQQREEPVLCELIDQLEAIGDHARLAALIEPLDPGLPGAFVRAGAAWLSLGAFRTAVDRMSQLRGGGRHQSAALSVLAVAASLLGRTRLAEMALVRLQQTPEGADPLVMADLWRRALGARLFAEQGRTRIAGADRNASLLQPMVAAALEVFSTALADAGAGPSEERADLETHRARCLEAMGRPVEAARALTRAEAARPPRTIPFVPERGRRRRAA